MKKYKYYSKNDFSEQDLIEILEDLQEEHIFNQKPKTEEEIFIKLISLAIILSIIIFFWKYFL